MSETGEKPPRRFRRLRVFAAGVAVLAVIGVASRWLPRDSFVTEVEQIGGRYRQQLIDGHFRAFLKVVHRQPLTVYHWIDLEKSRADDAWLQAHREDIQRQSDLCLFIGNPRITTDGLAELRGLENIDCLLYTSPSPRDS